MARTRAKFRVIGKFDRAGGGVEYGTVTIDRGTNVVEIRPLRRRKVWLTTLDALADMAVHKAVVAEVREKKAAKHKARRGRR